MKNSEACIPPLGVLFERARMLDRNGLDLAARQAYLDLLAQDMNYPGALTHLGALLATQGYRGAARTAYQRAIACHPTDPVGHVSLAHLLRTEGASDAARIHYEAALRLDPLLAEAHQGMSYLTMEAGDEQAAARHRDLGFTGRALTTTPFRGTGRPVTVLQFVSSLGGNIPTRHVLSDRVFLTHTLVAEYAGSAPLPACDVVLNAIGDADLCQAGLMAVKALLAASQVPVINRPDTVMGHRAASRRKPPWPPAGRGCTADRVAAARHTGQGRLSLLHSPAMG